MKKIFKYQLQLTGGIHTIIMPYNTKILAVQPQSGSIALWAEVWLDNISTDTRSFVVYGTGHDMPDNPGNYIGTVQLGMFVWHVYEVV
jgi:hypothetical protein